MNLNYSVSRNLHARLGLEQNIKRVFMKSVVQNSRELPPFPQHDAKNKKTMSRDEKDQLIRKLKKQVSKLEEKLEEDADKRENIENNYQQVVAFAKAKLGVEHAKETKKKGPPRDTSTSPGRKCKALACAKLPASERAKDWSKSLSKKNEKKAGTAAEIARRRARSNRLKPIIGFRLHEISAQE